MHPSQSVVVLQRLVWLCRRMREWKSRYDADEVGGGQSRAVFEASTASLQFSGDVSRLLSRFLLSLSVTSGHDTSRHLPSCLDQFRIL